MNFLDIKKNNLATNKTDNVIVVTKREGLQGPKGENGLTPQIETTTKHWVIGTSDTGVVAEGQTPYVGTSGNWCIGTSDTGYAATFVPTIDATTKHWFINGVDTGVCAQGEDGKTPYIGANGNWWINGVDTGHPAGTKVHTYESYEYLPGNTLNPEGVGNEGDLYVVVDEDYQIYKFNNEIYHKTNSSVIDTEEKKSNLIKALCNIVDPEGEEPTLYTNIFQGLTGVTTEGSEDWKNLYDALINKEDFSTTGIDNIFKLIAESNDDAIINISKALEAAGYTNEMKTTVKQAVLDELFSGGFVFDGGGSAC